MNQAWLEYFDRNDFHKLSARELMIVRLAFKAGWEASQEHVEPVVSAYEKYFVKEDPQLGRE